MVAFASMAFGIVGIIASLCCKDVDKKMDNKVRLQTTAESSDGVATFLTVVCQIEVYLENDKFADRNQFH